MCEANAYVMQNGKEDLFIESVDELTPLSDNEFHLVNIFGEQKTIKGKLLFMNLVDHKIVFEMLK